MSGPGALSVDFAGEVLHAEPGGQITVGRAGDVLIDDNPYLHRIFLSFADDQGLWWVTNCGTRLPAYLTHQGGTLRSTLSPGGRLPLVLGDTVVTFGAGDTLYELDVTVATPPMRAEQLERPVVGDSTISPGPFTESQLLAVLALSEPVLRRDGSGAGRVPTSGEAAARLGWGVKRFDKKVENVCDKLTEAGVRGLRPTGSRVAAHRRLALVEYAVATLLVTAGDLHLLDLARRGADSEEDS